MRREATLSPGIAGKNDLRKAVSNVDKAGENNAAWANATRSAGVAVPAAALQYLSMETLSELTVVSVMACKAASVWANGVDKSKCQSLDSGVRCPNMTSWSLNVTVAVVALKLTSQPTSHNCPIEMSGEAVSAGTM